MITKKEAKEQKIKIYKDWRRAKKGNHILTTDGMVLKVLGRKEIKDKRNIKPTIYLQTEIGIIPTSISGIYAKRVPENVVGQKNYKKGHLMTVFVEDLMKYGTLNKFGDYDVNSIVDSYQSVYQDNNDNTALMRGRNILKRDWVKQRMSEKLKGEFQNLKIDEEFLAKEYIKLIKGKKTPKAVVKSTLDKIKEILEYKKEGEGQKGQELFLGLDIKPMRKLLAVLQKLKAEGKIVDGKIIDADFKDIVKEVTPLLLKDKETK